MTEPKPARVVALKAPQWQALAMLNVMQLHQYFTNTPAIHEGHVAEVEAQLVDLRDVMVGWKHASAQAIAAAQQAQPAPAPEANGVTKPKGKGGWPKGKSRKSSQPTAQVQ